MPDGSLAKLIKKAPPWEGHWTLAQTADVILQAAQAIEYMHTLKPKMVHRDIKPANFLLHREQRPERIFHLFLSDFGISRWQRTPFDQTDQLVGTLAYMAPEQILYQSVPPTADQYSLAVLAHQLLIGKMLRRNSENDPTPLPPSQLNPKRGLSPEMDQVILKALQLEPARRYPSVLAFAEALQHAVIPPHDEPTQVDPYPPAAPDQPQPQLTSANEKLPHISIKTFGKYKDPTVDRTWLDPPPLPPPLPPEPLKLLVSQELPASPRMLRWSRDGNYLICTFFDEREAPILVGRDGSAETLHVLVPARLVCWGPDGRVLAISGQQGKTQSTIRVWRMDAPGEKPVTLSSTDQAIEDLDWSIQGRLAVWVESRILVYTLPQHFSSLTLPLVPQTLTRPDMYCGNVGTLRWSPDGTLLAAGTRNGEVLCWRVNTPNTQRIQLQETVSNQFVHSLAWSPDSTRLAVAFINGQVVVWDVHNRQLLPGWKALSIVPRMLSVSTKQRLVVASDTGDLLFGNLDETSPSTTHSGYWPAAWSPTGTELAMLDAKRETTLVICG